MSDIPNFSKIYYLHGWLGEGRVTIAFQRLPTLTGESFRYGCGVSLCAPKDNFERAVGREVALNRMMTPGDPYQFECHFMMVPVGALKSMVWDDFIEWARIHPKLPHWVKVGVYDLRLQVAQEWKWD